MFPDVVGEAKRNLLTGAIRACRRMAGVNEKCCAPAPLEIQEEMDARAAAKVRRAIRFAVSAAVRAAPSMLAVANAPS